MSEPSLLAVALSDFATRFINDLSEDKFPVLYDETAAQLRGGIRLDSMSTLRSYVRFVAIVGILAKLENEKRVISQRDVYYALKFLFASQLECNKMILLVGKNFRLKRFQMRIEAGSRGSVAGYIFLNTLTPTYSS